LTRDLSGHPTKESVIEGSGLLQCSVEIFNMGWIVVVLIRAFDDSELGKQRQIYLREVGDRHVKMACTEDAAVGATVFRRSLNVPGE
jgi:hypothetical protein